MDPYLPELFESKDSNSDEEELSSSPPAIYGFKPGPDFLVAEEEVTVVKMKGVAIEEHDVGDDMPGLSDAEDSDSEECSSPPAIYGFGPGPGFVFVEEKVTRVKVTKAAVEKGEIGEVDVEEEERDAAPAPPKGPGGRPKGSCGKRSTASECLTAGLPFFVTDKHPPRDDNRPATVLPSPVPKCEPRGLARSKEPGSTSNRPSFFLLG